MYKSSTETPPDGKKEQDGVNKRAKDPQGHAPKSKSRMRKTPARTHQGGCEKHTTKLKDRNHLGCTSLHGRRRWRQRPAERKEERTRLRRRVRAKDQQSCEVRTGHTCDVPGFPWARSQALKNQNRRTHIGLNTTQGCVARAPASSRAKGTPGAGLEKWVREKENKKEKRRKGRKAKQT